MRRRDFLWLTLGGSAYASLAGASALQQSLLDALGTQLPARTLDGAATTIPTSNVGDLAAALRGRVLLAGDPAYDQARRVWNAQWDRRPALGVVMAAAGYPLNPRKGDSITGLPQPTDDAVVFHAGTVQKDGAILTSGGRVLCVTTLAGSVKEAQQRAYELAQGIRFDGAQYRRDIGHRAVR